MADSTHPLTPAEREKLLRICGNNAMDWGAPGQFEGVSGAKAIRFFLSTGAHPWVLSHAQEARLRIERRRAGLYLSWDRPKTRRAVSVPVPRDMEPWIEDFLATLPHWSTKTWNRLVQLAGQIAEIEGTVTPRTLRHTYLRWVADQTHDPSMVARLGACSPSTALDYVRTAEDERDEVLR